MYYQSDSPDPANWWDGRVLGLTRNTWMLLFIGMVLAIALGNFDWDWICGRHR